MLSNQHFQIEILKNKFHKKCTVYHLYTVSYLFSSKSMISCDLCDLNMLSITISLVMILLLSSAIYLSWLNPNPPPASNVPATIKSLFCIFRKTFALPCRTMQTKIYFRHLLIHFWSTSGPFPVHFRLSSVLPFLGRSSSQHMSIFFL